MVVAAKLGDQRISITLNIDERGHVTSASTDARPRMMGSQIVPTPWRGRFSDWRLLNGFEVPAKGEVEWVLEDGPFPCWRGEIIDIEAIDRRGEAIAE